MVSRCASLCGSDLPPVAFVAFCSRMEVKSQGIQSVIDWIRGDDAILAKPLPKALAEKHINEVMNRHPFHPFDPELPSDHMCGTLNAVFGKCMEEKPLDMPLHLKHVNCYHPHKVELMKCLVKARRRDSASTGDSIPPG